MSHWYERHPKITLSLIVVFMIVIADVSAGFFMIGKDYNSYRIPHGEYHHDLKPWTSTTGKWGEREYPVFTNSLGFRDAVCRRIDPDHPANRILLLGDSFTEALGVKWEDSFAGILDSIQSLKGSQVLNAAAVSYSPRFYFAKTKNLIQKRGLKFNHLILMLDNSDPLNEITYADFRPYKENSVKGITLKLIAFLYNHSYIYHSVKTIMNKNRENPVTRSWNRKLGAPLTDETSLESEEFLSATPFWSIDSVLFERWGKKGMSLAAANVKRLAGLCRENGIYMSLVVYPWPSVIIRSDTENIQVEFWRDVCEKNNIQFINLYPVFINTRDPENVLKRYFIPGDVHWNEYGHRLVATSLLKYLDQPVH